MAHLFFELINNSRIIGGSTEKCSGEVEKFYKKFIKGEVTKSSAEVAEMVKLVENSYRDLNIAFSNEITMICNQLHMDPYEVIALANKHPRVNLLNPGIGVGGHCLPVDPYFIIESSPTSSKLIQASRSINQQIPEYIVSKLENLLKPIHNPKVGVWGVTYKGDSEDARNSPAMEIINILKGKNYNLRLYDPLVSGISSPQDKHNSIKDVDLLLILVNHKEFRNENFSLITSLMKSPIVFDAINIIDKSKISKNLVLYNLGNI